MITGLLELILDKSIKMSQSLVSNDASSSSFTEIASTSYNNTNGPANSSLHPFVTQKLVDTGKYYCPFLERSFCRNSSRCNFSHDCNTSIKIPTDFCHFYLANQCLYGQDCKFIHDEPFVDESYRVESSTNDENNTKPPAPQLKDLPLCPFALASGSCPYPEGYCNFLHGLDCDLCCLPCLHPYDEAQQRQHRDDCLREHEREMELSFAVQRSKGKICGICMDTVVEKKPITSSRFGILEKCNHVFCLDCIRKWRGTKQFDSKTIRACPECRVNSDFVVPSKYWVEDQDDKEKLIHDYKAALRSKPCRYFKQGKGQCPFAGSCFYKHAYPDGTLAELEAPKPRRRVHGARGTTTLTDYVLWSLVRSFNEDEWSSDDESESRFYIHDDEDEDEDEDTDVEFDFDDDGRITGARSTSQFARFW